jgi:hypothetical protein
MLMLMPDVRFGLDFEDDLEAGLLFFFLCFRFFLLMIPPYMFFLLYICTVRREPRAMIGLGGGRGSEKNKDSQKDDSKKQL